MRSHDFQGASMVEDDCVSKADCRHLREDLVFQIRQNHDDIQRCEVWAAEHDGRINGLWENQDVKNLDIETRMRCIEKMGYKAAGVWAGVLFIANLIAFLVIQKLGGM
jgi:hypothetical protein